MLVPSLIPMQSTVARQKGNFQSEHFYCCFTIVTHLTDQNCFGYKFGSICNSFCRGFIVLVVVPMIMVYAEFRVLFVSQEVTFNLDVVVVHVSVTGFVMCIKSLYYFESFFCINYDDHLYVRV